MRADTLHLTLAFLGDVDDAHLPELGAIGRRVAARAQASTLLLDRLGHWAHNRIDWAGCTEMPQPLAVLAGDLRGELQGAGFPVELRPFVPHVTITRKRAGDTTTLALPLLRVPVDVLLLVESRRQAAGAEYAALERWSLG
jgi:2'-5' RNA ligase